MVSTALTTAIAAIATLVATAFSPQAQVGRFLTALDASYLESLSEKTGAAPFSWRPAKSWMPAKSGNVVPTQYKSYLDSLTSPASIAPSVAAPAESTQSQSGSTGFCHVPLDYFHFDNLSSKGPRATYDWGTPEDWSRKFADDGVFESGTWYCTEGGWATPNGKGATEVFYMVEGHGCLCDADGVKHYFGPGDMVIIPKGHTGRWDVNTPVHKLWVVNDHPNVEESGPVIRVQVNHYQDFSPQCLSDTSANDPLYGNTGSVSSASNTFYDVGPTKVGVWTCNSGSFEVASGVRQWFHMLEGTMFITDSSDGTSKRCVAGDTVMLPAEWSGYVDVVKPTKKVFTVAL
jgi:uncharacterized cupin superfamily protein